MVVIEHQKTDDRNPNPSNAGTSNDASDGFETASDTDLGSDVDTNDGRSIKHEEREHLQPQNQHTEQEQEKEQGDHQRVISSDYASNALINEEELNQVAKSRVLLVVHFSRPSDYLYSFNHSFLWKFVKTIGLQFSNVD